MSELVDMFRQSGVGTAEEWAEYDRTATLPPSITAKLRKDFSYFSPLHVDPESGKKTLAHVDPESIMSKYNWHQKYYDYATDEEWKLWDSDEIVPMKIQQMADDWEKFSTSPGNLPAEKGKDHTIIYNSDGKPVSTSPYDYGFQRWMPVSK